MDPGHCSHWVFGYGSLIFKADFPFAEACPASITGWQRRFWQGSHDHRGTPDAPGRVVTLIPIPDAVCHGLAYRVPDEVFDLLEHREKNGYRRLQVAISLQHGPVVEGTTYYAGADNEAFLGAAPDHRIASHILASQGPSGSNLDYLERLARALRRMGCPDSHVENIFRIAQEQAGSNLE